MTAVRTRNLREGENVGRGDALRHAFQRGLQLEQDHARHAERRRDPELVVRDQGADQIGRQRRHLRRDPGDAGTHELVPVREQQERRDGDQAECHRDELGACKQGDGIADQPDQGKRPDPAEAEAHIAALVFFALQSDQERQEENQQDLESLRWQPVRQVHGFPVGFRRGRDGVRGAARCNNASIDSSAPWPTPLDARQCLAVAPF